MNRRLLSLLTAVIIAGLLFGCGGDDPTSSVNRAPNAPTINSSSSTPAHGSTDAQILPTLSWLVTDPDGDAITNTVYFGTTTPPPIVSTGQSTRSYSPAELTYSTIYYWSVTAIDPDGESTSSPVWNFTTGPLPAETVSAPNAPDGNTTAKENETKAFLATGGLSSSGHAIEYRYDWDDGSANSNWVPIDSAMEHAWANAGTYQIKAQARCIDHPEIMSAWSTATTLTVSAENISTPNIPSGPATGETDQGLTYSGSGAFSSYGDDVEYMFNWGDGSSTGWYLSSTHIYSTAGSYKITTQARCIIHQTVISAWSDSLTVTITAAAVETIATPDPVTGTTTCDVGQTYTYSTSGTTSTLGHPLSYEFKFVDDLGTVTTGYSSSTDTDYIWSTAGITTYTAVRARCQDHPSIVSAWSDSVAVTVTVP